MTAIKIYLDEDVHNHDERYAMAEEAFAIMTQLWRGEPCDFEGRYYRVKGDLIGPTVVQQPYPAIATAGASPAGLRFTARYADWHFMPGRMAREDALARIGTLQTLCEIALTFPLLHPEEIKRFTTGVLPLLEKMGIWVPPHRRGWSW